MEHVKELVLWALCFSHAFHSNYWNSLRLLFH